MNEFFAFQPNEKLHPSEMRRLMSYFGLPVGRFIVDYPPSWKSILLSHDWSELERKRIVELLTGLNQRKGLYRLEENLAYASDQEWIDNVKKIVTQGGAKTPFSKVLTSNLDEPPNYQTFDSFGPIGVNEEHILSVPQEFARVCRVLLRVSHEVTLVDKFFDLTRRGYSGVVQALFDVAAKGPCKKFTFIAHEEKQRNIDLLESEAEKCLKRSGVKIKEFRLILLNQTVTQSKISFHERFLLSSCGGISFDHGFASLDGKAKVKVSPVSQSRAEELYKDFVENQSGLPIAQEIVVRV